MHVTHLDDQIIATRGVLGSAIPLRGVPEPRPYDWRAWQRDLSNGITQQTPGSWLAHGSPWTSRDPGGRPIAWRRGDGVLTVWTGQPIRDTGYYRDEHGHCLLLRSGEPAPICMYSGAAVIRWQLIRPLPLPPPVR